MAGKAPGARVIKAFNTLFATDLVRDPRHDGGRRPSVGWSAPVRGRFRHGLWTARPPEPGAHGRIDDMHRPG